ncbi:MAG: flagellar basal body-associated FliL family protein [Candidatus Adiutrix sp.]|jgi:flagellar basal body-associated protein FliL|nr:flagellar basal body-associated FliL family protein [Candidatus Adiutrix sp.]
MADEQKTDPALDDWDSLPLDPAADDWDAQPAKPAQPEKQVQPEEPAPSEEPAPPEEQAPPEKAPPSRPAPMEEDDFDEEAPGAFLDGLTDGLGDGLPNAAPAPEPEPEPQAKAQAEAPKPPAAPPKLPPPPAPGSFDAFLGENAGHGVGFVPPPPAAPKAPTPADKDAPEGDSPDSGPAAPLPQKVELDIEGIDLDDLVAAVDPEDEPAAPAPEPPPPAQEPAAPAPAPEPPPPEAEAHHHRIPLAKLLILVLPALVVLVGLGFVIHRLFIHTPPPPPEVLVIDPTVPPREPEPGEVPLKPFYINFAGEPEVIVEMSAVLYYNDISDRELIEANLPSVREVIFRLTRNKGGQVVTNGGIQRALRQELRQAANEALGAEAISYVQLTQFRILH